VSIIVILRFIGNVATHEYWEVFTKKKHICPNRVNKPTTTTINTSAATPTKRPSY
jgi:hypothetical protein